MSLREVSSGISAASVSMRDRKSLIVKRGRPTVLPTCCMRALTFFTPFPCEVTKKDVTSGSGRDAGRMNVP